MGSVDIDSRKSGRGSDRKRKRKDEKTMKNRLVALLLAGLMTASLASCVATGNNGGGTEGDQTRPPVSTNNPTQLTDVDQLVYVIAKNAELLPDINTTLGALSVERMTELHRVKLSDQWSVVEYNGTQYYVATAALTADDILGKLFTPYAEALTMYASGTINVRTYASADNSFSTVIAELQLNTPVKVLSKGLSGSREWSKVQFTDAEGQTQEGFVRFDLLSATEEQPPIVVDYSKYFTTLTSPQIMYVYTPENPGGNINLRSAPTTEGSTWAGSLKDGTQVEVIATGKDDYASWCKIRVARPQTDPDDPQFYDEYYVHTGGLTPIKGGQASSLDDILTLYRGFEAINKTYYVSNEATQGLFVRSAPDFTADNVITGFLPKTALKVVAQGSANDVFCYVVEFEFNAKITYGFVSARYVTPDSNGTPVKTLESLLATYGGFTALPAPATYVATAKVNCSFSVEEWSTSLSLAAGDQVTVVAQGTYSGASLYILEIDGNYYFAATANLVVATTPA